MKKEDRTAPSNARVLSHEPAVFSSASGGSEAIEMDTAFEPMTPDEDFTVQTEATGPLQRAPIIAPVPVKPWGANTNGMAQPAPALGGLFRKRTALPHEMIDDDSPPQFMQAPRSFPRAPSPGFHATPPAPAVGQRPTVSHNPFQTAGERLQVQ